MVGRITVSIVDGLIVRSAAVYFVATAGHTRKDLQLARANG